MLGGACEPLSVGYRAGEMIGEPTATKVEMQAECGVGHWSPATKQRAHKTVEVLDDGTVRITGASLQLNRNKNYQNVGCRALTEYLPGKGDCVVEAAAKGSPDRWQPLTFSRPELPKDAKAKDVPKDLLEAKIPEGTVALRIQRPGHSFAVEDQYLAPAVKGGTVVLHKTSGRLTTRVQMAGVVLNLKTETTWLLREVRFRE